MAQHKAYSTCDACGVKSDTALQCDAAVFGHSSVLLAYDLCRECADKAMIVLKEYFAKNHFREIAV